MTRAPRGALLAACALTLVLMLPLAGCGGGGVDTGGTGATTGYAAGPITGFGSVIVGGVRFDDSSAEVEDLDGTRRNRDELRLGMTVEVDSGAIATDATATDATATATATARRIRFESELVGLIGSVNPSDSSFMLLGQRVTVDASTVFDDRLAGGLAGLRVGEPMEVYAVFDTVLQRYRATRVEPSTVLAGLRLRGPLAAVDTAAQTLRIGTATYSYAGAANVPAGLAAGQFVRLRMELEQLRWMVRSFGTPFRPLPDSDAIRLEGLVTAFVSASSFAVNGRAVDATGVATPGVALGVRVEVEGQIRSGTVRATRVQVKSDDDVRGRFELFGPITSVNTAQGTFVLRGLTVSTARSDLRYEDGGPSDLRPGRTVEVRAQLAPDLRTLEATRIRFR
jgi:hypothetical protein